MTRPCADVGKAEFLEKLADIAGVVVDAEALGDDPLEIDPWPAHDAVDFPIRDPSRRSWRTRPTDPARGAASGIARPIVEEAFPGRPALKR